MEREAAPAGAGKRKPAHSGRPGTPPYGHYRPVREELAGTAPTEAGVRKRGPGLGGWHDQPAKTPRWSAGRRCAPGARGFAIRGGARPK
jgi:hypothetical protein